MVVMVLDNCGGSGQSSCGDCMVTVMLAVMTVVVMEK
jgi:hypothetical protein